MLLPYCRCQYTCRHRKEGGITTTAMILVVIGAVSSGINGRGVAEEANATIRTRTRRFPAKTAVLDMAGNIRADFHRIPRRSPLCLQTLQPCRQKSEDSNN